MADALSSYLAALSQKNQERSIYNPISQAILSTDLRPQDGDYRDESVWGSFAKSLAQNLLGSGVAAYGGASQRAYDDATRAQLSNLYYGTSLPVREGILGDDDISGIAGAADFFKAQDAAESRKALQALKLEALGEMLKSEATLGSDLEKEKQKALYGAIAENPYQAEKFKQVFGEGSGGASASKGSEGGEVSKFETLASELPMDVAKKEYSAGEDLKRKEVEAFLTKIKEEAGAAEATLASGMAIQEAAKTPGLEFSSPGEWVQGPVDYFLQGIGLDTARDRNAARSTLESQLNVGALARISPLLKGNTSEREFATMLAAGRGGIVDAASAVEFGLALQKAAERTKLKAALAEDHIRRTGSVEGFESTWQNYIAQNPLFPEKKKVEDSNPLFVIAPTPTPSTSPMGGVEQAALQRVAELMGKGIPRAEAIKTATSEFSGK